MLFACPYCFCQYAKPSVEMSYNHKNFNGIIREPAGRSAFAFIKNGYIRVRAECLQNRLDSRGSIAGAGFIPADWEKVKPGGRCCHRCSSDRTRTNQRGVFPHETQQESDLHCDESVWNWKGVFTSLQKQVKFSCLEPIINNNRGGICSMSTGLLLVFCCCTRAQV